MFEGDIKPDIEGEWVRYADYAAILAKLEKMERERYKWQKLSLDAEESRADTEEEANSLSAEVAGLSQRLCVIGEYVSGWRQRLDKTGPDYTIEGGGYIPEEVINELEEILAGQTP